MIEPGMPDLLVEYGNEVFQRADGRLTVNNHVIADEQTWGEMVNGYRCAWCLQAQITQGPWPEKCEFVAEHAGATYRCANPDYHPRGMIRDHQMEFLGQQMRGHADYSPSDPYQTLDDERDHWKKTKTGIVIPNHPSLGP